MRPTATAWPDLVQLMNEADCSKPMDLVRPLSDREHRRNMIALKLAALDLMSVEQIRLCAEAAVVRRGLMG